MKFSEALRKAQKKANASVLMNGKEIVVPLYHGNKQTFICVTSDGTVYIDDLELKIEDFEDEQWSIISGE